LVLGTVHPQVDNTFVMINGAFPVFVKNKILNSIFCVFNFSVVNGIVRSFKINLGPFWEKPILENKLM
jgi:hypothetical protein